MTGLPELSARELNKFRLLRQMIVENPAVLTQPDCTYDEPTRRWLHMAFAPPVATPPTAAELLAGFDADGNPITPADDWGDVRRKTRELYKELEDLNIPAGDIQEKIQTVKAKAGLLDRLITMGERAFTLKQMNEFIARVLKAMEDSLTPDQREEVMAPIRRAAGL